MTPEGLLAFLGVAILVTITPGQDMALVLRNTLWSNRRAGIATSVGIGSGLVIWAVVASAGVTAVLLSSRPLFTALKVAGALYLAYLGFQSLRSAFQRRDLTDADPVAPAGMTQGAMPDRTAFRQGILSNLGNPKIAVFYSSLLPQFVGEGASFGALLSLGLLHCLMGFAWLTGYAIALDRAAAFMRRSRVRRVVESITGVVLVALAVRLATARR